MLNSNSASFRRDRTNNIDSDFWQRWEQYRDDLYRCCLKWMNGNPTEAEDAIALAMLKAWEKVRESASAITNFKAWLTKLTHNLCMDMHRERNRNAFGVENLEAHAPTDREEWISQEETPLLAATRRELELFLRNTIDNLPPRLRETFILYWEKEQSYQEIAQQLNISYDNVRKRISQARAILRQQLNEYEGEKPSAPAPSRKQRQPIKTETLASSGEQESVLNVVSEEPQEVELFVETTQHYQGSHGGQPLQQSNEKREVLPQISPPAKLEPIEPVLVEAQSDGKLEETEIVRWEIEEALPVGQPAPTLYPFNLTVKQIVSCSPPCRGGADWLPAPVPQSFFVSSSQFSIPCQKSVRDEDEGAFLEVASHFCIPTLKGRAIGTKPAFAGYIRADVSDSIFCLNKVYRRGCKLAVGKVDKRHPLVWEMLELFELRWRVWADSGGCWLLTI